MLCGSIPRWKLHINIWQWEGWQNYGALGLAIALSGFKCVPLTVRACVHHLYYQICVFDAQVTVHLDSFLYILIIKTNRSLSQAVGKSVCHIPLMCVQWKTPDDGQRNCLKYVDFCSKNKFEKLVHLVGFIARTSLCTSYRISVTCSGKGLIDVLAFFKSNWSPKMKLRLIIILIILN